MAAKVLVPGLAGRLRAAREGAGLSQVATSERSGVHRISIMKFETERTVPTLDVLLRLAKAYGVTVCSLIPEGDALPVDDAASVSRTKKAAASPTPARAAAKSRKPKG